MGKLIVITGPSGVGKGTLVKALLNKHPEIVLSISMTTRAPRPGEIDGVHYYFVTIPEFQAKIEAGELLEWAEFAQNFYGTPKQPVWQNISQGKLVLLEIELEGARQIRQSFAQAIEIFILPPSEAELEKRLRGRGQDTPKAIERRLSRAKVEIAAASEFDYQIINDDFDTTLQQLESLLQKIAMATQ